MTTNKTDKRFVFKVVAACQLTVFISHLAWLKQFTQNIHNAAFLCVYLALWGAFIYRAVLCFKYSEDGARDNSTKAWLIVVTIAFFCWVAGWACGLNGKTMFDEDVKKAKQEVVGDLYLDTNHLPAEIPAP